METWQRSAVTADGATTAYAPAGPQIAPRPSLRLKTVAAMPPLIRVCPLWWKV